MKSFLFGMMMFVSGAVVLPVVMHRKSATGLFTATRKAMRMATAGCWPLHKAVSS